MLVMPTGGLVFALAAIRGNMLDEGNTLRLMKNDVALGLGTTEGDLIECDFSGYAPLPLTQWGAAAADVSGNAAMQEVQHTWVQESSAVTNTVYGYYVTLDSTGELLFAEKGQAGGFMMDSAGKTYSVTPTFTLRNIAA